MSPTVSKPPEQIAGQSFAMLQANWIVVELPRKTAGTTGDHIGE